MVQHFSLGFTFQKSEETEALEKGIFKSFAAIPSDWVAFQMTDIQHIVKSET